MDAKYITTASGEPIHSWLTIYTIRLSFISYKDVVQVKVVIKSFISAKNKYAEEVTFAFKIFLTKKTLIKSESENGF